jgi:ribosomal protein S18 acetylase RimI-like enzyme
MRRLAEERDEARVYALYMDESVVPYLGYDPMPPAGFGPVFGELLASGCFFVYELDGELAGFYRATRYSGRARHVAGLGTLAVAPRFQGRGVAGAMVGDAIARLRAAGVRRVELSVESDNPRALRFYQRLGFEVEGTLRQLYKRAHQAHYVDNHVMGLLLER